jgi:hypothetical protein
MILLHNTEVEVWCVAICATRMYSFQTQKIQKMYTEQIFAPLFKNLSDKEEKYSFFQQYSPTPHTANNSVAAYT